MAMPITDCWHKMFIRRIMLYTPINFPFAHQCCVREPAGFALSTAAAPAFCELHSCRKYVAWCALTQETAARRLITKAPRDSMCLGSVAARRARISRHAFSIGFESCEHFG